MRLPWSAAFARQVNCGADSRRYEHCSLDSFESAFGGAHRSLGRAHLAARKLSKGIRWRRREGLLLTGSIGVGKTHLAGRDLRGSDEKRGVQGLFYEYRDC